MADTAFIRFSNVAIPAYSRIKSARIVFKSYEDLPLIDANVTCHFADADNPSAPTNKTELDAFSKTTGVDWTNIEEWDDDFEYRSPDLASDLQEVIDRDGWSSGNAVVFLAEDNSSDTDARRMFSAIEYRSGAEKAKLCVSWVPPPTLRAPEIDPIGGIYFVPITCTIRAYPSDVSVYYTLDGTDPDENSSLYTQPFTVYSDTTVKARAYREYAIESAITEATFNFQALTVIEPESGNDDGWTQVVLSNDSGNPIGLNTWYPSASVLVLSEGAWKDVLGTWGDSNVWYHYLNQFFIRFPNIQIAQGETLNSATLKVWGWEGAYPNTWSGKFRDNIKCYVVQSDNAVAPSASNFLSLPLDSGTLFGWPDPDEIDTHGAIYLDLKDPVQAIINRAGWRPGNAIMVVVKHLAWPIGAPWDGYTMYRSMSNYWSMRRCRPYEYSSGLRPSLTIHHDTVSVGSTTTFSTTSTVSTTSSTSSTSTCTSSTASTASSTVTSSSTSSSSTTAPPCPEGYSTDRCENGTADADWEHPDHTAEDAFDNLESTYWSSLYNYPNWISYEFASGVTRTPRKLRIQSDSSYPGPNSGQIYFEGSENGNDWIYSEQIALPASWPADTWREWIVNPDQAYHHFRVRFTAYRLLVFRHIEMLECAPATTSTTTTTSTTSSTTA